MAARPVPLLGPVVVGRDAELAALRTALAEAEQGRGAVVVLAGGAGMGKPRLLRQVPDAARSHGNVVGEGRSLQSGSATAFRPLAEALLHVARERAEGVLRLLRALAEAARRWSPAWRTCSGLTRTR